MADLQTKFEERHISGSSMAHHEWKILETCEMRAQDHAEVWGIALEELNKMRMEDERESKPDYRTAMMLASALSRAYDRLAKEQEEQDG